MLDSCIGNSSPHLLCRSMYSGGGAVFVFSLKQEETDMNQASLLECRCKWNLSLVSMKYDIGKGSVPCFMWLLYHVVSTTGHLPSLQETDGSIDWFECLKSTLWIPVPFFIDVKYSMCVCLHNKKHGKEPEKKKLRSKGPHLAHENCLSCCTTNVFCQHTWQGINKTYHHTWLI